jgi:hypothetical protein
MAVSCMTHTQKCACTDGALTKHKKPLIRPKSVAKSTPEWYSRLWPVTETHSRYKTATWPNRQIILTHGCRTAQRKIKDMWGVVYIVPVLMSGGVVESWCEASGSSVVTLLKNTNQSHASSPSNFCFHEISSDSAVPHGLGYVADSLHINMGELMYVQ